jgi:hypothetical protein
VKRIALTGGDGSAPNIVPGKPDASPLLGYVAGQDPDLRMPPEGPALDAASVATLRNWIAAGAVWPDAAGTQLANPLDWWSLKPIARVTPPSGEAHPIDAFIRARLRAEGLAAAPSADARTLARRLYFDLTGLPPTPAELAAFLADASPAAYERLVDRLLASPRYGERWARHWLDVVHYGDTHGYDKDKLRPERVAVSRLRHSCPEHRQALRTLPLGADRGRRAFSRFAGWHRGVGLHRRRAVGLYRSRRSSRVQERRQTRAPPRPRRHGG